MKRYRVSVSGVASADHAGIVSYVCSADGLERALAVDRRIDEAMRSLTRLADRGRVVPELRRRGISVYRELIAPPYRILYRVIGNEVWVLAVIDGRRDTDELLLERARLDVGGGAE